MNPASHGRTAFALIWRPVLPLLAAMGIPVFGGPPAEPTPPDFGSVSPEEVAAATATLDAFKRPAQSAPYYLEFVLTEIPRWGGERTYKGRLWGAWNDQGSVLRISLEDGEGREHRFLLQNGPQAEGWAYSADTLKRLGPGDLLRPLVDGVEVTPFDLEMPYLYWGDARLVAVGRILGRPADEFLFRGQVGGFGEAGRVAAVRSYFDTQFSALVKTELVDTSGTVLRTLSLVDLKKVGKQWIPKEVDVRNPSTRAKTRIEFTAAALGIDLSPTLFSTGSLGANIASPSEGYIERFAP
jgi:hypothetical protein